MTTFETELRRSLRGMVHTWKRQGTTGCSFNHLLQNASHLPYTHGFADKDGAPRGANAEWLFRNMLENIVAKDNVLARFIR